jgi:2-aminoadipate transaminase
VAHATQSTARFAAWVQELGKRAVPAPDMNAVAADMISFGGGQPAVELYPLEALERAFSRAILEDGRRILPYGAIAGLADLRAIVAERLARRGIQTSADHIVITTGSMQGLHLVGRAMLDFGDTVVTEAPTFSAALGTWEHQQPKFLTIPVDEHGLRVDLLEETLRSSGARPKFAYVLPTFQNPSGVSLSLDRRQRLLELAREFDLLIIEDDPYGEFWYDEGRPQIPPLRSLPGAEDHVVYLGTFSKILAPGLRLAYAVASPALHPVLIRAKRGLDYQTDALVQQGVVRLVRDGDFDLEAHVANCRRAYKQRRDAMLDALETTFSGLDGSNWTRPAGGYFLWLDLPEHCSDLAVTAAARAEGVEVWPGSMFYPKGDGGHHSLRLSFADSSPERIAEGIHRLQRGVAAATSAQGSPPR